MSSSLSTITPEWSAPAHIEARFTTRLGGVSQPPYDSLNLGLHVGDNPAHVWENRNRLALPSEPLWLEQVHSDRCIELPESVVRQADASFTRVPGVVLAVMVADCLPVLVTNAAGSFVAVVHAGWRGLQNGVLGKAINAFNERDLIVWIGPAISAHQYEVGDDVRAQFSDDTGFSSCGESKWQMDLKKIAQQQLSAAGISEVYVSKDCTFRNEAKFFSYRRSGETGRMAGLIWIREAT